LKLTGSKGTITVKNDISKDSGTASIKWSTGKTSVETYTYKELTGSGNTCPGKSGYTKLAEAPETGLVTSGSAAAMDKGKVAATVCAYQKSSKVYLFNDGPVKS
jgi:hypothetical protein